MSDPLSALRMASYVLQSMLIVPYVFGVFDRFTPTVVAEVRRPLYVARRFVPWSRRRLVEMSLFITAGYGIPLGLFYGPIFDPIFAVILGVFVWKRRRIGNYLSNEDMGTLYAAEKRAWDLVFLGVLLISPMAMRGGWDQILILGGLIVSFSWPPGGGGHRFKSRVPAPVSM